MSWNGVNISQLGIVHIWRHVVLKFFLRLCRGVECNSSNAAVNCCVGLAKSNSSFALEHFQKVGFLLGTCAVLQVSETARNVPLGLFDWGACFHRQFMKAGHSKSYTNKPTLLKQKQMVAHEHIVVSVVDADVYQPCWRPIVISHPPVPFQLECPQRE